MKPETPTHRPTRHLTVALVFLWCAFVARGVWYSMLMPAWEGYDEPFHFAALQNVASGQGMPRAGTLVSLEVQDSLHLLPLPWELQFQSIPQPLTTHDNFWTLSPAERTRRIDAVDGLSRGEAGRPATEPILNYESQQAPLYYWLFAIPLRWMSSLSLLSQVYLLRILGVLLASGVVPLSDWIAKRVLQSELQAVGVTAVIVLLPELMINVARVGNESLALICYSFLLVAALQVAEQSRSWRWWILLGIALGVGLLTKAYFLTAIPAVIMLAAISVLSSWNSSTSKRAMPAVAVRVWAALMVALAIAGGWYARVHAATGSWSGQGDDAALRQVSLLQKLSAVPHVNWRSGVLSVLISHIWFGGWSFLRVPIAIYVLAFTVLLLAIIGFVVRGLRRQGPLGELRDIAVLASFYLCFWAGLAYHVLVTFLNQGVSASTGWYLHATVVAEVILLVWGLATFLSEQWLLPLLALGAAALDLYGVHALLMPYYTGLLAHAGTSVHAALWPTLRHLPQIFSRLGETRPAWLGAPVLVTGWIGYWVATAGTVVMILIIFERRRTV